jgi:hypothetical protein
LSTPLTIAKERVGKPVVEIPHPKDLDAADYRRVLFSSQETQSRQSQRDLDSTTQETPSSPVRYFQPSSRPRNPFVESEQHSPSPSQSPSLRSRNLLLQEDNRRVAPVIPDSQYLLGSASYKAGTVPDTDTTSDESANNRLLSEADLGADTLLVPDEDLSHRVEEILATESSPAGSSSYKPRTDLPLDIENSSNSQQVSSGLAGVTSQESSVDSVITVTILSKEPPVESDLHQATTQQASSSDHLQLSSPASRTQESSDADSFIVIHPENHSSGTTHAPTSTPSSQPIETQLLVASEDEGYSEPLNTESVERLVAFLSHVFPVPLHICTSGSNLYLCLF